jgi:hypothetical protein
MAGKSDYAEGVALKLVLGAAFTYTPPANVYLALYSATPSDSGGGTELTGGGYVRQAVANNMTQWPWTAGHKSNSAQITFAAATGNWLPVVAIGIFDAASAGNLLFWVAVTPSVTIFSGQRFSIPVNGLQLSEV